MSRTKKTKMPSAAAVARELRGLQKYMLTNDGPDASCLMEVRLQVHESGSWELHSGDPGYDTDHHGYWGASEIDTDCEPAQLRNIAEDLVEQAADHVAQCDALAVHRIMKRGWCMPLLLEE